MQVPERESWLVDARQGDCMALGRLLESYRPYLRVLLQGAQGGQLEARLDESDLIQATLLEASRHFARFRGQTPAEFTAWVRQIALFALRHALRDHVGTARRATDREVPLDGHQGELIDPEPTPVEAALRADQAAFMAAALSRLPADMQEVLLGRHFEGLDYAELSRRTGRSEGALRVGYTRALRALRRECGEQGP